MPQNSILPILFLLGFSNSAFAQETPTIVPYGDIRQRWEFINSEGVEAGKESTYNQTRLRARLGVKAKPTDDLSIDFRLATAVGGTSTNQTYGDITDRGMKNKTFNLDRAYFKYSPVEWIDFTAGRMANPLVLVADNDLLYDIDLNFDGVALGSDVEAGDITIYARLGSFIVAEEKDSATAKDIDFMAAQLGARATLIENLQILGTLSQYVYTNVKGHAGLDSTDPTAFFGNSNDGTVYTEDYNVLSAGLEVAYDWGFPVSVYGEYAKNQKLSEESTAFIYGVRTGRLKDAGDWIFAIDQRSVQKDSTFGAFTDSDSFGGGTNGRSLRVTGAYNITKSLGVQLSAFTGEFGIASGETALDRNRYHIDINARF
ncbi:MAG TPA: putative porin [Bdellovibrionales bacterium]|nr:putative porin [Bdellovibrionales bacterium]